MSNITLSTDWQDADDYWRENWGEILDSAKVVPMRPAAVPVRYSAFARLADFAASAVLIVASILCAPVYWVARAVDKLRGKL